MSFLLDTHVVIWWLEDNSRLIAPIRERLASNETPVFFSAVNAYEISLKHWLGKLPLPTEVVNSLQEAMARANFELLPLSATHALRAGQLDFPNRDPFDRMLIAQALTENLTLISNETGFDSTGVKRLWD